MPVEGEYEPSAQAWVRDQVELYEGSGGTQGTTLRDTGLPVVIVTNIGASSGKVRKTPVMRVEHDGSYAMVASRGGAPTHPLWYHNVRANPRVELQHGPRKQDMVAREVSGRDPGVRPGTGGRVAVGTARGPEPAGGAGRVRIACPLRPGSARHPCKRVRRASRPRSRRRRRSRGAGQVGRPAARTS